MRRRRALLLWRAVTDHRAAGDQRRAVRGGARILDGESDGLGVMPVDGRRMPAGSAEALDLVVGHREIRRAVDRDLIVVEQHDEPSKLEMPGERDRLLADPLHQAAVAGDDIGQVIDDLIAIGLVQKPLGDGHADGVAEALPERAGGGLDPRRMAVFRVPRRARAELTETLQLLDRHLRIAGQIKQRVEQHRAVPGGKNEAVAVRPIGVRGVELQEAREEHGGHVGHAHRHAGMAGIGLLHRVHGQRANGVGHVLVGRLGECLSRLQNVRHRCSRFQLANRHERPSPP